MRPFVLINVAMTADGKIDTVERRGAAISSDADRVRVDALRASVDAVMVGGRTLLQEDPRLTVRSPDLRGERRARGQPENPAKVGVVSSLRVPPDGRFVTYGPARVLLFAPTTATANDLAALEARDENMAPLSPRGDALAALEAQGVEVHRLGAPRVDLVGMMHTLRTLGLERVLVEGGATLNFELLRLGLVDEVNVYLAPMIFGGADAPTLAGGAGLPRQSAIALERERVELLEDGGVLVRYAVTRSGS